MIAVATDNNLFEIIKDVNKLYNFQLEQISTQEPEKVYNSLLKNEPFSIKRTVKSLEKRKES